MIIYGCLMIQGGKWCGRGAGGVSIKFPASSADFHPVVTAVAAADYGALADQRCTDAEARIRPIELSINDSLSENVTFHRVFVCIFIFLVVS